MARIIARKERSDIHVKPEKVADSILVFSSIKPPEHVGSAGIGLRRRSAIQRRVEICGESFVGHLIGPWKTRWRHIACTNLAEDFFPHIPILLYVLDTHAAKRKTTGFQPIIVAAKAILVDQCPLGRVTRHSIPRLSLLRSTGSKFGASDPQENESTSKRQRSRCLHVPSNGSICGTGTFYP